MGGAVLIWILIIVIVIAVIVLACTLASHKRHDCCEFERIQRQIARLKCRLDTCCPTKPQSVRYLGINDSPQVVTPAQYTPLLFPNLTQEKDVVYNFSTGGFQVLKSGLYSCYVDVQELVVPDGSANPASAELFVSVGTASDDTVKYGFNSYPVMSPSSSLTISTSAGVYANAGDVIYFVTRIVNAAAGSVAGFTVAQNNATIVWNAPQV